MSTITNMQRMKMSAADFAGPNRTFPVMDQEDIAVLPQLVGRALDPDAVKQRALEIARRKRLEIPAEWRDERIAQGEAALSSAFGALEYGPDGANG